MRHHSGSFDLISSASRRPLTDQCLFLVPDVHNKFDKNAVMLHNGSNKLAYVAAQEAIEVRKVLQEEADARGHDVVLVVTTTPIKEDGAFKWATSFNVKVIGVVYERVARKYGAKLLTEIKEK